MQLKYCSINKIIANKFIKLLKNIKFKKFVKQVNFIINIKI